MILTGGAVEYAEGFEKLKTLMKEKYPGLWQDTELSEEEQIDLYQITQMYHMDKVFRKAVRGFTLIFAIKAVAAKTE